MSAAALPGGIASYLADHNVMTLATHGGDGPWAAAVFYAWCDARLVFLSAPGSRHGRNLERDPRVAATIHDDTGDWKAVRGIQLEGRVERLEGAAALEARRRYAEKFPVAGLVAAVPPALAAALAKVAWYQLLPDRLCFIDNSRGFGHRDEFDLRVG